MATHVVVYTMQGCPHCVDFKEMLQKEGIDFVDRDIEENDEEYQVFVEVTKNDYVPALLIIEEGDESYKSFLYAPERDYNELTEALDIIKKHL
jgi:glutaredoxin